MAFFLRDGLTALWILTGTGCKLSLPGGEKSHCRVIHGDIIGTVTHSRSLFTIAVFAMGAIVSVSCHKAQSKYQPGQVWSYKNARADDSRVLIVSVHTDSRYGEVVIVNIEGLHITTVDQRSIHRVSSVPFSKAALDESVITLAGTTSVEAWGRGEFGFPNYTDWKKMNGSALTWTVADFVSR